MACHLDPVVSTLDDLLPHRPPARVVDEVVSHDGDVVVVAWTVDASHPLVVDGTTPAGIALEVVAQGAAVHAGLVRQAAGQPPETEGFVVGVPRLAVHRAALPVGRRVEAHVVREDGDGALARYTGTVSDADGHVADVVLTVMGGSP